MESILPILFEGFLGVEGSSSSMVMKQQQQNPSNATDVVSAAISRRAVSYRKRWILQEKKSGQA